jgi:hypothetical protein
LRTDGRISLSKAEDEGAPVDQRVYVIQLNIEHYQTKLTTEADPAKRDMLQRLLAEEKAKLALNNLPAEQKPRA